MQKIKIVLKQNCDFDIRKLLIVSYDVPQDNQNDMKSLLSEIFFAQPFT